MNSEIRKTLEAVKSGELSVDDALLAIKKEPFEDIGYAKVDLHRGIRQGAAEVIYGAGKTPEQMTGIIGAMLEHEVKTILITRLSAEKADVIQKTYPQMDYRKDAKIGTIGQSPKATDKEKRHAGKVFHEMDGNQFYEKFTPYHQQELQGGD